MNNSTKTFVEYFNYKGAKSLFSFFAKTADNTWYCYIPRNKCWFNSKLIAGTPKEYKNMEPLRVEHLYINHVPELNAV